MQYSEAQGSKKTARVVGGARNARSAITGAECCAAPAHGTGPEGLRLMEAVVERGNMRRAYERVVSNKGAGGIDEMTVEQLGDHLRVHWPSIRQRLLAGRYVPQPVRAVSIPKPAGGVRTLGIPTVVDRLIQQALNQVLQPLFEPGFSESSYGFRPKRNAWQAVQAASQHIASGRRWVVDMDLEKFFDRVNHDVLMARLAHKIADVRVLRLIRRFLTAGLMQGGLVSPRIEGTPQGGPLSPLLSNVLLDDLDRELQRRGHAFVRYADDANIYVGSRRAGEELLARLTLWLKRVLKLTVNASKSAVDRPWKRTFLGYSWLANGKLRIAPTSLQRLREAVRGVLRRRRGLQKAIEQLNPKLRGWMSYFRLTDSARPLEELDGWVRRKLRRLLWQQAKRPRTRQRHLIARGLDAQRAWKSANNGRGPWWNSGASHMHAAYPKAWFDAMGLVSLLDTRRRLQGVQ